MKAKSFLGDTGRFLESRIAAKFFQIACLGFVGALGFIPGWHRLFGFTGFFGFFGLACLAEMVHRRRRRDV